jgi:hypothetical protein
MDTPVESVVNVKITSTPNHSVVTVSSLLVVYLTYGTECNSSSNIIGGFLLIVPFLLVLALLLIAKFSQQINSGILAVVLDFIQVLALFSKFQISWPLFISGALSVLSFANFNFQLIGLDCYFSG